MQQNRRKAVRAAVVSSAVLFGLAAGTAMAATTDHTHVVLKDWQGKEIVRGEDGSAAAYSVKTTCFGTVGCHGNSSVGNAKYGYDEIERHNYHAQLGANEFKGYNPANPDAFNPYTGEGDKWRVGAGPQGKNWVQSAGHFGSW